MSIFSDERVDALADKMFTELKNRELLNKEAKSSQFKAEIKKAYVKFYKINEEVELLVKKRIESMSKAAVEGTSAYKALFEKHFLEEWKKR